MEDDQYETVLPLPFWIAVFIMIVCWPASVFAGPMVKATVGGVEITVYTEDCQLKEAVSNLPKRATWVEKGKTFEGCAGAVPQLGVLMFYFKDDKTVAAVPMDVFAKVTSI
jgi:hypothetical protein